MKERTTSKIYNSLFFFTSVMYAIFLFRAVLFKHVSPFELFETERFSVRSINIVPFGGYEYVRFLMEDVIINTLIYFPFGFLISMQSYRRKFRFILLAIPFVVSVLFELLQYLFSLGATDITDVISNSFGAVLGFFFYSASTVIFKNKERINKFYTIMMFIVACLVLFLMI